MAFYDCERCGDDGASNIMQGHSVLSEVAFAKLCTRCLNLWVGVAQNAIGAEWAAWSAKSLWLDAQAKSGHAPSCSEYEALMAEKSGILGRSREIALSFIRPIPRELALLEAATAGQNYQGTRQLK